MMKKLFILFGLSVFLVSSCVILGSPKIIFDDSIPVEETSWLWTDNVGKIIGYNGIEVNWQLFGANMVQIPAGKTVLEWEINALSGNTRYRGKNMLFAYNFQPSTKYYISFKNNDGVYGLSLFAYELEEPLRDISDHFVEFVPFLNNQGNQKTVLD